MGKLIYTDPQHGNQVTIVLGPEQPVVSIGRSPQCTIHCNRKSVSRRHAEFHYNQGLYEIVDLNSSNGTYVIVNENRRPVKPRSSLSHNDEVWCGDFILYFYEDLQEGVGSGDSSPTYNNVEVPDFGMSPVYQPPSALDYPPHLPETPAPEFPQTHLGIGSQSFDQHIPAPDEHVGIDFGENSSFGAQPFQADSDVVDMESFDKPTPHPGISGVQSFTAISTQDAPQSEEFTPAPFQPVLEDSEAIEALLYEDAIVPSIEASSLMESSYSEQPFAQTQSEEPSGIIADQAQEIAMLRGQLAQNSGSESEVLERAIAEQRRLEERLHTALQNAGKEQAYKTELDELEARHEQLIAKHQQLVIASQQAEALQVQLQHLEHQAQQDQHDKEQLTQQVGELLAQIEGLSEQAAFAQDAQASLRELERSRRLLSEFEQRTRTQQQELDETHAELETLRATWRTATQEAQDTKSQLEARKEKLHELTAQRANMADEITRLKASLDAYTKTLREREQSLSHYKSSVDVVSHELEALRTDHDAQEQELARMRQALQDSAESKKVLAQDVEGLKQRLRLEKDRSRAGEEVDHRDEKIAELQATLDTLRGLQEAPHAPSDSAWVQSAYERATALSKFVQTISVIDLDSPLGPVERLRLRGALRGIDLSDEVQTLMALLTEHGASSS